MLLMILNIHCFEQVIKSSHIKSEQAAKLVIGHKMREKLLKALAESSIENEGSMSQYSFFSEVSFNNFSLSSNLEEKSKNSSGYFLVL